MSTNIYPERKVHVYKKQMTLFSFELFYVTDRVGIKPRFYHKAQPGGFYEGEFLGFYGFYKSESLSSK